MKLSSRQLYPQLKGLQKETLKKFRLEYKTNAGFDRVSLVGITEEKLGCIP